MPYKLMTNACFLRCVWARFAKCNLFQTSVQVDIDTSPQWRHNGHDSVSCHQPHHCLLNRLFRRRSKKISKLRVTGLCAGIHQWPVNSPHTWPITRKMFPFDDVIMWWRKIISWDRLGHTVGGTVHRYISLTVISRTSVRVYVKLIILCLHSQHNAFYIYSGEFWWLIGNVTPRRSYKNNITCIIKQMFPWLITCTAKQNMNFSLHSILIIRDLVPFSRFLMVRLWCW